MKKILVTGAAGFIGCAVARKFQELGYDVFSVDNLSTGMRENIPEGVKTYYGNDYEEVFFEWLKGHRFEGIVHIAGQSSGEVSFENPEYDILTNTISTIKLLKFARESGCNKFIYASSMSVYGDHEVECVNEKMKVEPKSFYAVGKMASENYMRIYSQYGIQCTALRFFNVYGIGQNMSNLKQGMFSIYLAQAIDNHHIIVKGSKKRFRDFVYITDIVNSVIAAFDREQGNQYEVINISCGEKHYVEEQINIIKSNLPYEVSVEYVEGTPGDQMGIYGDNTKAAELLNWKPSISFEDGTSMMINWALSKGERK